MRLALVPAVLLVACAGASTPDAEEPTTLRAPASDSAAFLLEVGGTLTDVLTRPSESIESLEASRGASRGEERRRIQRDLARAHMLAAEETEGREQRRHRTDATTAADAAAHGSHDDRLVAEMDFLALWVAWRAGQRSADGRAQRFVRQHETSRDLVLMAWLIRGEVAFAEEEWDDAITAYRAVLGHIGHPLYAFALYRSARAWHEDGRSDESRQALGEVRDLGCSADASPATLHVALAASTALGDGSVTGPDGRERPATCPEEGSTAHTTEDERPPVLDQ